MELDDLDRRLLKIYLDDARFSLRKIAAKLNVSVGTVHSRVRKLEKEKIVKGYAALLDHEKLGYQLTVITEITVSKGRLLEMESEIAKLSSTCAVYDITGSTDALVIAKFKTRDELSRFTKHLLTLPFVERTNTHIVLTTVKEDFRLL